MNHTIYFRKEVWEQFKDEPDKSKVINSLLEDLYGGVDDRVVVATAGSASKSNYTGTSRPATKQETERFLPEIPGVVRGADFVPKPPDPETGYPCCSKKSPCKHWSWDGNVGVWTNSLTGKTREV